jgi:predicted TPR repeat methyltransferase
MSDVFGTEYARSYDAIYREKDYDFECDLLERVFSECADNPVRNVLDLGCGTGNHSLRLAGRGYGVTGVNGAREITRPLHFKVQVNQPGKPPR